MPPVHFLALTLGLSFAAAPTLIASTATPALAKKKKKKKKKKRKRRAAKAPKAAKAKAPPPPTQPSSDLVPTTQFRGPTRIDFDDRLIQGQTNKSGAVYLFDRKETGISSMVRRRKSFRHLTISTIYD